MNPTDQPPAQPTTEPPTEPPAEPTTEAMTPRDACRLFSKTVALISSCGVEIRGLDVSAIEFHPPGAAVGVPANYCAWCGSRRHRRRQPDGTVAMFDCEPRSNGPYTYEKSPGHSEDICAWRVKDAHGNRIATCFLRENAVHLVAAINAHDAMLRRARTTTRDDVAVEDDADSIAVGEPPTLPTLSPTGPLPNSQTGDVCAKCGSHNLTWSGSCKTCRDCGDAGGCG